MEPQQISALTGGDPGAGRLVVCLLSELRHHPSYLRLGLGVSASQLSAIAKHYDLVMREPLVTTRERVVIDGYARWELARLKGQRALPCVQFELTEEEAIRWLIQKNCRSNRLNDFSRILLASELEPHLKDRAVSNQRVGGRMKASSNLTKDATVDVRREIATAAGVSVGNVTKVKQLGRAGHPELLQALRDGEVSIHRAWQWSKGPTDRQVEALRTHRAARGINKSIRDLIARHKQKGASAMPDFKSLARELLELGPHESDSVTVSVIQASGKLIFVTEELVQSLRCSQGSMAVCATVNH